MKRKTLRNLTALCAVIALNAQAELLMKWQRLPLPIDLQVEKERVILVDKNVKVGYPKALEGKIRLQSTGGAVYLKALEPFPTARLQLKDMLTNEIILLDITAKEKVANPQETVRLLYEGKVENQSGSLNQDEEGEEQALASPQLPVPAALTRYAALDALCPIAYGRRCSRYSPNCTRLAVKNHHVITCITHHCNAINELAIRGLCGHRHSPTK